MKGLNFFCERPANMEDGGRPELHQFSLSDVAGPDQMGFRLPWRVLNSHLICHPVQHLGLLWHQCAPDFFGPMNICFLYYPSPDVISIQPNLTLPYYFLSLVSNLFRDIVICWVLTWLPNLEASVICINKRIPLFNLLIKTQRNNISIRSCTSYLETLALLTNCFIY